MSSMTIAEYQQLVKKKTVRRKRPAVKTQKVVSEGEATLAQHLKVHGISFETEFKFHQDRKWRADFYLTGTKLLIEVEGGIWSNGRHTRGRGYQADIEKYNAAAMLGYTVLRFSTADVKSGRAIEQIKGMVSDA
ncbi:DUF559 domain-containing protein [Acinetobacter rudis]|uniref:DUF559 domain-containing protein n=1 Tax=Acinetobacter rudis TaxID=632955 RepID=UPI00280E6D44|nr:DUF559 domain-containing protein [Acinetobacter rudis]MDQ8954571.1 DUF559 domain-containing protein [Acinetobacter rudis]